jgi:hypothetical protein
MEVHTTLERIYIRFPQCVFVSLNNIQPHDIFKNYDLSFSLSVPWWLWWFRVINFLPLFIYHVKNVLC